MVETPILIGVDCGRTAAAGEASTEADCDSGIVVLGGVVGIATNGAGCGSGIVELEGVVARLTMTVIR